MRKRYYIMFVARDADGELLKVPIPLHYVCMFLVGAIVGMLTITGMAGSYTRMLLKTERFNQLRTEKETLKQNYTKLEKVAQEKEVQVASLGSLASEVSALYGLRAATMRQPAAVDDSSPDRFNDSFYQLATLRTSALSGVATIGISSGMTGGNVTLGDWSRMAAAPTLWPVDGRVTGSFGERIDPFNGEGAFHTGVDISSTFGSTVVAPADGVVRLADSMTGYGRCIVIDHGNGITTLYGHLANFAVMEGQTVHRGETIGYVGQSGRSTGPHLHYEVRIHNVPVNPYKYLRASANQMARFNAQGD
jgi:murein DD-endopeptidase MepM/ murein hydrolase activator NlpD